MKNILLSATVMLGLAMAPALHAQDAKPLGASTPSTSESSKPASAEAEAKFTALLANATMAGRWAPVKDGELGAEKEDKYSILGVKKIGGDTWMLNARMRYGQNDITIPIPVLVKWAGDTPVLIVDKFAVPGGGTYSARVLFFEKTYSGSWTGNNHGGLLYGVITKTPN